MAIIWACQLSVEDYAAAGRGVAVPRQRCPVCRSMMSFSSGYGRRVRAGAVFDVWVRRGRCRSCRGASHALLPSFCLLRRLDAVEVIGPAVTAVAAGVGTRRVAKGIAELFAYTTVRGWWRRHRERVEALLDGLAAVAAVLRVSLPCHGADADGAGALESLGVSVSAGLGIGVWPAVSLLSAGAWLSTTTSTPFLAVPEWRLMTVMAACRSTVPP
jgi:hypothetical protein